MQGVASTSRDRLVVVLPVARGRAVTRALVWATAAALLWTICGLIYDRLHFRPTAMSNRVVDFSVAVLALPLALAALYGSWKAMCGLALGVWPASLAIIASDEGLLLRLGPLGTRRFDADRLDVRYPFELVVDEEDAAFESFLSEQEQCETLLPRITHPAASEPLDVVILRLSGRFEREAAAALRPVIERWRERRHP